MFILSLAKFEFFVDLDNFFYAKCGDTIESAFEENSLPPLQAQIINQQNSVELLIFN